MAISPGPSSQCERGEISPSSVRGTRTVREEGRALRRGEMVLAERVRRTWRGWFLDTVTENEARGVPDFWVHTFGMKVPLDAVFCARDGRVLKVMTLSPNKISPPVWGTKLVWETRAGGLAPFVKPGDFLTCE